MKTIQSRTTHTQGVFFHTLMGHKINSSVYNKLILFPSTINVIYELSTVKMDTFAVLMDTFSFSLFIDYQHHVVIDYQHHVVISTVPKSCPFKSVFKC